MLSPLHISHLRNENSCTRAWREAQNQKKIKSTYNIILIWHTFVYWCRYWYSQIKALFVSFLSWDNKFMESICMVMFLRLILFISLIESTSFFLENCNQKTYKSIKAIIISSYFYQKYKIDKCNHLERKVILMKKWCTGFIEIQFLMLCMTNMQFHFRLQYALGIISRCIALMFWSYISGNSTSSSH